MQQQSPQMLTAQPHVLISTQQIQKYLDENKQLILAIMETQNLGKLEECAQYQTQLQKNLMYLAAVADAQPPAPTGPPQPQPQSQSQPQIPMQATMPQSPFMMPPKPAVTPQLTTGPRLPFVLQSFDQQSAQMQYPQSMAMTGAMGMRMGVNNGSLPGTPAGFGTHLVDTRGRQDGSEGGGGDRGN